MLRHLEPSALPVVQSFLAGKGQVSLAVLALFVLVCRLGHSEGGSCGSDGAALGWCGGGDEELLWRCLW